MRENSRAQEINSVRFVILLVSIFTSNLFLFILSTVTKFKSELLRMSELLPSAATSTIKEKWGQGLTGGFVLIPSALLRNQYKLNLDCAEVVVLMNLVMHWWSVSEYPFPRTSTLAKRMGVSTRTAQRNIESLEQKKMIRRIWKKENKTDVRAAASYDLTGIVTALKRLGSLPY